MVALGFAAGLPFLLIAGSLAFRLSEAGMKVAFIGYLSWMSLPYAFKWMWSPLVDQLPLPWLTSYFGQRRSWLLLTQGVIVLGLVGMGLMNPAQLNPMMFNVGTITFTLPALLPFVLCTLLVAVAAATQDIALDAFRIESAAPEEQGILAASYQAGYRLSMIWSGAGILWIVAFQQDGSQGYNQKAWSYGYLVMAFSMLVGIITVLFSKEPLRQAQVRNDNFFLWLRNALVEPFIDFFARYRSQALTILLVIGLYRISDIVMGAMAYNFYQDLGFTKIEVANVSKVFGVIMTILGTYVGGTLALRFGIPRILTLGAVLAAASNLLYAGLSHWGHNVKILMAVVSVDNLSSGIASAVFIAYLSSLTNTKHTATQYAVLASLMQLAPRFIAGWSGVVVEHVGYANFFIATTVLGLPVIALTLWMQRRDLTRPS